MSCYVKTPVLLLTILLLLVANLNAQEFNWTNATGTGEWSNPSNWNLGGDGFPGDGSDVNINGGFGTTLYQSTQTTNPTTLDLAPGAQLDIQGGKIGFPANGPFPYSFQNNGEINVLDSAILEARETARNFSPATINLFPGGTLEIHSDGAWLNTSTQNTGNGTINMMSASINGGNGALLTLTNQSIFGFGDIGDNSIGLSLGTNSIIESDVANLGLTIDVHNTVGISNAGIMRASGGGAIHFTGPTPIDNTGGVIEALADSEVSFDSNINVVGGTLRRVGTGVFDINASGTIDNVFLDGTTITVPNGGSLNLVGAINNGGLIETNSTTTISDIRVDDTATLTGGGIIRLGGTISQSRLLDVSVGDGVLTNVDNTIEGHGSIGVNLLHLINEADGVINANDTSGDRLTLDPTNANPMINRGLFAASSGGELFLTGGEFDNAGGVIEAQDGSFIEISSTARVVGGTLRNVGTGTFIPSSGFIEDVTIEGTFNVQNGRALNLEGTINNLGEIVTDSTTTVSDIRVDANATLTGGGTVTLGGTGAQSRLLDVSVGNGVLTNVDNTIQGKGAIGVNLMRLINEQDGTVSGSDPTGSLTLDPPNAGPMINRGLYTAVAGGDLLLSSGNYENTDGMIRASSMSTITITNGANVDGGPLLADDDSAIRFGGTAVIANVDLQSIGSGEFMSISGSPTLTDSTNDSTITVNNSAALGLDGEIVNNGLIETNSTTTISDIRVDDSATLTGGGTIRLGGTGSQSRVLDVNVGGAILTNVDNAIEGRGSIGVNLLSVINQADGVIDANDSSGSGQLVLDPANASPMINRGLYTASAGGRLFLTGGLYDNVDGLLEPQDDSFIEISSTARVVGGRFRNFGTGMFIPSSGIIEDATIEGTFNVQNSKALNLAGTINNLGEIVTDSTTTISDIRVDDDATLTGGGIITLGGTASQSRLLDVSVGNGVLTNVNNTIQGRGAIGVNLLQVINQIDGTIQANVAGTLTVDMPTSNPTFENDGTLKASNGGTLNFVNDLENYGRMEGDSTIDSNVPILNAGTIAPGTSIGNLTLGNDVDFTGDSAIEIELGATTGTPGVDWDQLIVDGTLDLSVADLVTIKVTSLDGNGDPGMLAGFDANTSYSWRIVDCDDITGFSTNIIAIDSSEFENSINGIFIVAQSGTQLFLNYVSNADQTNSTGFATVRGVLQGGDLNSILDADDQYLRYNPGFTLSANEPPVWVEFESVVSGSPEWLNLRIESNANTVNIVQTIEVFNWLTSSYDVVSVQPESFNQDSAQTISIPMPADYIQAGTGNVKARSGWKADGFILLFPWTVSIDQAIWLTQ